MQPCHESATGCQTRAWLNERVSITLDDGVAQVRLDRPDKRNALDLAMFRAIAEAGESLKSTPGVRVVVLAGEGASFCAGLDFGAFEQMAGGGGAASGDGGPGIGDLTAERPDPPRPAGLLGLAGARGARDRRAPRSRARWRSPDRTGGGHPHRPPRHQAVRARGPLGPDAGHDRHVPAGPPRAARRRQGAELHGPHLRRTRSAAARRRDQAQRSTARRRERSSPPRSPDAAPTPCAA